MAAESHSPFQEKATWVEGYEDVNDLEIKELIVELLRFHLPATVLSN